MWGQKVGWANIGVGSGLESSVLRSHRHTDSPRPYQKFAIVAGIRAQPQLCRNQNGHISQPTREQSDTSPKSPVESVVSSSEVSQHLTSLVACAPTNTVIEPRETQKSTPWRVLAGFLKTARTLHLGHQPGLSKSLKTTSFRRWRAWATAQGQLSRDFLVHRRGRVRATTPWRFSRDLYGCV